MFELTIQGDIASAHYIEGHPGKCKNLHGHSWKIEVTVASDKLDQIGMVADFSYLKERLRKVLENIDHVCLNDLPFFKENKPTTENIAKYIYEQFSEAVKPLKVKAVRAWESGSSSVTYKE